MESFVWLILIVIPELPSKAPLAIVFTFFPIYTVFNLEQAWNIAFPSSSIDKSSEIVNVSKPHLLKQ